MGSNWWLKLSFVLFLLLLSVRALVPTFAFQKPDFLPNFEVQYKTDVQNKPVLEKDGSKVVLYETLTSGKKKGEPVKDENNRPIPLFARDAEGRCKPERDAKGRVVFVTIPKLEADGKPVLDKDKKPVLEPAPLTDSVWERCYLPSWYRTFFNFKRKLNLGLDLQGGTHLVMRVDVEKAIIGKASRLSDDLTSFLKEKKLISKDSQIFHDPDKIWVEVTLNKASDANRFRNDIEKTWDYLKTNPGSKAETFRVSFTEDYLQKSRESAVTQALETIRSRVDGLGVSEPSISKYGDTEIVIQLPGLKDPKRAKDLIGKTALLAFHVVEDDAPEAQTIYDQMKKDAPKEIQAPSPQSYRRPDGGFGIDRFFWSEDKEALQTWRTKWNSELARKHPKYQILLGAYEESESKGKKDRPFRTYLVWRKASLTGDALDEARPQLDQETNRPEVGLNFNRKGAELFEKMTGEHVGHRFAIILEGKIDSAPVIQSRIGGGRARITLGGLKSYDESLQDAKDLSFVLKSGSLPAPVDILYEKTVGPALGADSINRGATSLLAGFLLVVLFMIGYYRGAGLNANLALLFNLLFLLALMASFGATLTLPGLAGVVLTLGMAVDANILIFERIREELRSGKTVRVAVQNGYEKALVTILDANITTAIAGIVLYQYGSGPVRGFAVTLLIGILCSVFTAIFVSRLVFDALLSRKAQVQTLSI